MLSWFGELLNEFGAMLKTVLPLSPFRGLIDSVANSTGIGWLNWLFPVGTCLRILAAWLVAYGGYLIYSMILRWVKAIE